MRALGLNVGNGHLRWALLEGTQAAPRLLERGTPHPVPADEDMPSRMAWFRDRFGVLLEAHAPDRVAYRMHMGRGLTQEQVATFHYPWGVLLLCCSSAGIKPLELTGSSLTAKRFGLPKGVKPMTEVDTAIGSHPPHWDDHQRYAACAAWAVLP